MNIRKWLESRTSNVVIFESLLVPHAGEDRGRRVKRCEYVAELVQGAGIHDLNHWHLYWLRRDLHLNRMGINILGWRFADAMWKGLS